VKLLAVAFVQDQTVVVVGCSLKDSVILTSCQDSVQRHEKKKENLHRMHTFASMCFHFTKSPCFSPQPSSRGRSPMLSCACNQNQHDYAFADRRDHWKKTGSCTFLSETLRK
jgi:hypothetical protein